MKIITDDLCTTYGKAGHPEAPRRVSDTAVRLRTQQELAVEWLAPTPGGVDDAALLRAHSPEMIARLESPGDLDADTPHHPGIAALARTSVAAALDAMAIARSGGMAFSLMRPPGHHATRSRSMGFCYLNNIAIAALEARAAGSRRVAVLDFDVHHGNGTEDILLNQPGIEFFSVHQHPAYPDTGVRNMGRNCFNYPVAPGTPRLTWRAKLAHALDDLRSFRPDLVAVSAGFDSYVHDPLADGTLLAEDFHWLGAMLRALGAPFFSVLEGGYSRDLPDLVLSYLKGVSGK